MQRTPQNTMPPRGRQPQNQNAIRQGNNQNSGQSIPASPALAMARRIRNEQGLDRARQYLVAMEPFLAPAERAHIAQQIGVTLPTPSAQQSAPPFTQKQSPFNAGQQPPFSGMPFGQAGGMPFMGKGGSMNPWQMMQMLSGLGGMGKKGGTQGKNNMMGDPMMLAQMLGSMMGKK